MLMKLFVAVLLILVFLKVVNPDLTIFPKEVIERKALPMDVSYETIEAESYLNSIRTKMGMSRLSNNSKLQSAAKAHAYYLVSNNESDHIEIKGHKNFVGEKPLDRTKRAGYLSTMVSENLSTNNHNAQYSVDGLFSAIYHRFAFLNPIISEVGIGIAQNEADSDNSAFVYLMGNSDINALCYGKSYEGAGRYWKSCKESSHRIKDREYLKALNYAKQSNPDIILYPYDGQKEVPPAFYSEIPDPLPDHDVSGFPISVTFNDYFFKEVILISFDLFDQHDNIVNAYLMDKNNDPYQRFSANQFAIFPLKRLEYNQQYHAELVYEYKEKIKNISWSFGTTYIKEKLYTIEKSFDKITLETKKSYVIYFRPLNPHDLITNMQFPADVDVQFIDNNTIKLMIMSEEHDEFEISSGTRHLRIIVK